MSVETDLTGNSQNVFANQHILFDGRAYAIDSAVSERMQQPRTGGFKEVDSSAAWTQNPADFR